MKVLSIQTGQIREITWQGKSLTTGIWKSPVAGPVQVSLEGIEGDFQSDRVHHGGESKTVYGYPSEHYDFWKKELHREDLVPGMFGENLTIEGWLEPQACIGDRIQIGTAILRVTEARIPCSKLAARFENPAMIERFLNSKRSGIYFAVEQSGIIEPGDEIRFLSRDPRRVSILEILRLHAFEPEDYAGIRSLLDHEKLSKTWRETFKHKLPM